MKEPHPVDELDPAEFEQPAAWAAASLKRCGYAYLHLTPGDATVYPIIIARPDRYWAYREERTPTQYMVALSASFGAGYPWGGGHVDWGYAADKWTRDRHEWTARVIARFLSALSDALREASP
jgi:hypothetical protein